MIKIVLTNLIPDLKKQEEHDLRILEWMCEENDKCVSVLELSKIISAEKGIDLKNNEKIFQAIIDYLKQNKKDLILVDTSRDHYWRDTFEDLVEELEIIHNPYPENLFKKQ